MSEEIWKWIPGFERFYEVSNLGNVRTYKKGRSANLRLVPIMLKPRAAHHGYLKVHISHNGNSRFYRVHLLVLEVFVGPKPEGGEGGHLNGNSSDNRLSNLKWINRKENCAQKFEHNTVAYGTDCHNARFSANQIREIRHLRNQGKTCAEIARMFNTDRGKISRIARHKIYPDGCSSSEKFQRKYNKKEIK